MEFPRQNIPESKKTEEWHRDCINFFLSTTNNDTYKQNKLKDYENYLIATGEFDKKQFKYVTDMYGMTAPARLVNYPIVSTKLDLLAGELISQPLQYTVNVINRNAIRKKNEEKVTIATELILRPYRREIEATIGQPIPDEELGMEIPNDVEEFMNTPFRTSIEKQVNVGLNYIIQKWKLKNTFKRGFYDLAITGKEFFRVYVKNRIPYVERLDPRQVIYDHASNSETLQDSLFAGYENYYTVNEIIDRFELDEKTIEKLEELANQTNQWYNDYNRDYNSYMVGNESSPVKIRVVEFQWKSIKTIKYRKSKNKYDPEIDFHKMLPDDYKKKPGEDDVVVRGITEIRQAIKVGHEMIIKFGAKPNQIRYEENYANTQLDFYGVIKSAFNGNTLSVVDALKNVQLMYNLVMYHIDAAMARSGGKSIVYDVAQLPSKVPLSDVMYHMKNSGLVLINSKQEGGQNASYNQFKEVDLTLSQSVQQMMNLKLMLEDTADKLTGITSSRAGINKSSDAVGVNERSVMQSTLITAPLFDLHYQVVGDVLQGAANLMRYCWGEDGYMVNVFGDMGYQTFKIDKAVSLDEYGIFVQNSSKEVERKQNMMGLLNNYASSGGLDPILAIKAVNAESASEIETLLVTGLQEIRKQQEEMEERKVAAQEQANQIEAQKMEVPIKVAQINGEAAVQVAQINAQSKVSMHNDVLDHKEMMQEAESKSRLDEELFRASNNEQSQLVPEQGKQAVKQTSVK